MAAYRRKGTFAISNSGHSIFLAIINFRIGEWINRSSPTGTILFRRAHGPEEEGAMIREEEEEEEKRYKAS